MRIILLIVFGCLSCSAFSQLTPEQAAKALDSFAFMHPQEKVYVHTDRDMFLSGETIWFKTYITLNGTLSTLSKIAYVELANSKGEVVAKRMLKADDGTAAGEIALPLTLPSGSYSLNAYTLWMLNFPQFIFKKNIAVHTGGPDNPKASGPGSFSVQFLPESGNLVTGLESRVAFKAVDGGGMPLKIAGNVQDSKKKIVANISTVHDGMGSFVFTPQPDETYTAQVTAPGGRSKSFTLPSASPEGIVMMVNNDNPNRIFVQFNRSELNKDKYSQLLVIAQIDYAVVFTGKVDFDAEMTGAAINKKNLPPGILTITALNMKAVPLAERLVFIHNMEISSAPQLKTDTVNLKKGVNHFTIDLSAYQDISASAAVVNKIVGASPLPSDNIVSSTLLTSDLKGYVYDPGYYFRSKDTSTIRALDLLMMTQGWRRFKWESVVKYEHPVLKFPFETGLAIKGKMTGADGKKAVPNGKMELITKAEDSTTIISTATLNAKNEFAVYDLHFRKGAVVYYQGTNVNRQEALVKPSFYPSYFDTLAKAKALPDIDAYTVDTADRYWKVLLDADTFFTSKQAKTLATVVVTGKKRSPVDSLNRLYATDIFYNSDQTLPLDSNSNYIDIWQFLRRSVPGLDIRNTDTGLRVYFSRYEGLDVFSEAGGSSVAFFLNEVPVTSDIIDALNPTDVALVKVFKGNTANILGADRGAIALYTQKGGSARDWRKRGFDSFKLSGYSVTREFYHPVDMSKDEWRPTLYWNPDLKTDANGKAVIRFYNDRIPKQFQVIIQGIDKNGKMLYVEKVIQ